MFDRKASKYLIILSISTKKRLKKEKLDLGRELEERFNPRLFGKRVIIIIIVVVVDDDDDDE